MFLNQISIIDTLYKVKILYGIILSHEGLFSKDLTSANLIFLAAAYLKHICF